MTSAPNSPGSPALRQQSGQSSRDESPWWGPFPGASLAAVLLILAAYSNSVRNAFHFDDTHVIVDNLFIRSPANIPRFFTDAQTYSASPANAAYRPLVSLTLAIDYWLSGGLDPFWFHVTQLVLLVATGAMLLVLYAKLFASTGERRWHLWAALFAATFFCLHTTNTETENLIHVRSELLSSLGVLGGFVIYILRPAWRRYYLYLLPVVVGAFAKTPAVMFAPLLLLYRLLIEDQLSLRDIFSVKTWPRVRRSLLATAPAFAIAIGLFFFIEGNNGPALNNGGPPPAQYLLSQTGIWPRYLRLFLLPTGLSADTDLRGPTTLADPGAIAGILFVVLSLVVIWRTSRSRELRPVAFGIAWFWIALVPASSIFPLGETTNDHRGFFPFMGLTAAAVWWVCVLVARAKLPDTVKRRLPQIAAATALVVLGAHAIGTYQRNRVWLNEETLWQDVVAKSPRNGRGLMNYGLTQMRQGRYTVAKDLFTRAYVFTPNYPVLHVNLAIVTDAMGDSSKAEEWFQRALTTDPGYAAGHRFFASWLARHGRAPEGITHLEKAVELSVADLEARHALLDLYAARGDNARLKALAQRTLESAATDSVALQYSTALAGPPAGTAAQWYQRGLALTNARQYAPAAAAYRISVGTDSANADAWNNLGWTLGTLGFMPEAVRALEHAIGLRPDYTLARNNLAWVKAAVPGATFRRAFDLQTSGRSTEAIRIYRGLLVESPAWVNAHYNLGYALMIVGDCNAAMAEFDKTLALQPNYPLVHLHLSTCLQRLGRAQEAARHKAIYEKATGATAGGKTDTPAGSR